ncbi:MAG TPA: RHS repeat-associated core domain-containing protein [Gaiellaceae bacterium]
MPQHALTPASKGILRLGRRTRAASLALAGLALAVVLVGVVGSAQAAPPSTAITYAYDELGRLVAVSDPTQGAAKYTYDAVGNLTAIARQTVSAVSVLSFAPKAGPAGTTVTIYGTGYSATPSQNTVKFNGTVGTVVSSQATKIVATVPAGATTGTISVTAPGGTGTSSGSYTVGPAGPSITGFSPGVASVGGSVTVTGTGFDTSAINDVLATGKARAQVTAASATSLTGSIGGPGSGHVVVATPTGTATSTGIIYVPPSPYTAADVDNTASMSIGDTRTVSVGAANKIALVAFDGSSGQRVSLTFTSVTFSGSSCCSATASILNPDGSTLVSPSYFGTSGGFVDAATLPQDGTYTIVIDPQGTATGSASMTLGNVPADATASITPGGSPVTLTTTVAGQNGSLTFSGTSGQRISLDVGSVTFSGSSCCSATVALVAPDGSTLVPANYIGTLTSGEVIDATTLPQTGTYTLVVDPQGQATGSARFTLYNVPGDTGGTITPGGSPVTVTISTPGQNASYTFSGSQNQRISLNIDQVTLGTSSCCSGKVSIRNPDGSTLVSPTYFGTLGNTFVDTLTLAQTGTYTIFVDPQGNATGSARLTLYDVPADATGTITPGGAAQTVTTTVPGQNASYTFSGTQNQRISLNIDNVTMGSSSCCSAKVSIKNPDGSTLVNPTFFGTLGNTFIDTLTLAQTGTYTIVVDPQSDATGSARFSLYDVPADTTGSMSIGGPSQNVTVTTPGQNATLTFAGTTNKNIHLTLSNVTIGTSSCCSGKVSIKNPDGSTLVNPTFFGTLGNTTVSATLPVDGTYTILVDPQSNATGSATLTLTDPPVAETLRAAPLFDPVTNLLQPPRIESPAKVARERAPQGAARSAAPTSTAANPHPNIDFDTPDAEDWTPGAGNRTGDWRRHLPHSPWQSLAPLRARGGITALSGQTLTLNGKPLEGVKVELEDTSLTTKADDTGRFLLSEAPDGHHVLIVDGRAAGTPGKQYGRFEIGVDIVAHRTNALDYTIWMPKLDNAGEATIASPTTQETVVKTPKIPGLELHLQPGTTITDENGKPITKISISPVPVDRPPFPLPLGVTVPLYFTIQPGGAYLSKPAQLIYPNYTHLPAGQRVPFWNYDPDKKGWYIYGQGTVSADAKQVVPDASTRIYSFTGAMISGGPNPPNKGPKGRQKGGDPVDLGTGLFVEQKTDLVEPGPLPLVLTRTYRQGDANSYSFGIGTTMPYDLRLWSVNNYQDADLVLPTGGRIHYVRISPGTGFSDAVYEAQTTPSTFYRSKIAWNGNGWNLTLTDGTVYVFGDLAPLQSIRDRFGNTITVAHASGSSGNVTQVTASDGRWIKFTYDGSNRITQAADNAGRTVGYTYDGSGRLQTVTDAAGGVTTYGYDAQNEMTTIKDPTLVTYLTNTYDANGRVQKQTFADNTFYQYAYTIDGNGNVTQTDVTDPRGIVHRETFGADGYVLTDVAALGTADQQTTTYQRQAGTDLVTSITDPLNRRTDFTYDDYGDVTSQTRLAGTSGAVTTSFTYTPQFHQLATVTDPLNHTTTNAYNASGALTSITDPLNHSTTFVPNGAGQPTQITDALNHTSTLTYVLGDLVRVTDSLGGVVARFVDNAGRVGSVTDPLGNVSKTQYDALNDVLKTTDPKGAQNTFVYDANGRLKSLTDAATHQTTFAYNNMGRLSTRTDPLTHQQAYAYDADGNVTSFTDAKGQVTTYRYDNLNRRTFVGFGTTGTPPNQSYTSTIAYTFDAGDRLRQTVDSANGTITDVYDDLNRLTSETTPQGTVSSTYDVASRRATMTVTGQPQVTYSYDAQNRLTQISNGTSTVGVGYDDTNRQTSTTLPDGIVETYAYDNASRVTGITDTLGANTLGTLSYDYDATGRRDAVWGSYARTGLPAAVSSRTYDAGNELTKIGNTRTTNDLNGSLTSDGTTTYTWNNRAQLASTSKTGTTASYTYDAFGRRKSKTLNGTTTSYLYDGPNVVQELNGSTPTANLLAGPAFDETYLRSTSTESRSFLTDALGSPIALADGSGTIQTSYTYDPFGNVTTSGASSSNTFQYAGRESDGNGLVAMRDRYYSPALERFISQDQIGFAGGDVNAYTYAGNDPINATDPTGKDIGGGILVFVTCVLSGHKDAAGIAVCALFGAAAAAVPIPTEEFAPAAAEEGEGAAAAEAAAEESAAEAAEEESSARLPQDEAREAQQPPPEAKNTNRPNAGGGGAAHNAEIDARTAEVEAEGAQDVRVNQEQVDASGKRVGRNRPDLQYTINGQRYYEEWDTDPARSAAHEARIKANDPNAIVIPHIIEPSAP